MFRKIYSLIISMMSLRFLGKAAIMTPEDKIELDGSSATPWSLCSMQQIEQVKCLVRVIPIWAAALMFSVAIIQQQTYAVFQALQSDRRLGNTNFKIPAASYYIFTMLALTIWIPIYDRIIVPFLERLTKKEGGITLLQRMGTGMVIVIIATLISAIVESRRRSLAISNPAAVEQGRGAISSLSGLWLVPQLTLAGISEAFTIIAKIEFYYKQFPENMRSIGGSLTFVGAAAASYLNGLLITIVHRLTKDAPTGDWLPEDLNKGRLDYFYYLVAALGVLNFGFFIVCANKYKYKGSSDTHAFEVGMEDLQSEKTLV